MEYGIFERTMGDGDSVLLNNFVVQKAHDLSDPYEWPKDVFEGALEDCLNYLEEVRGKEVKMENLLNTTEDN